MRRQQPSKTTTAERLKGRFCLGGLGAWSQPFLGFRRCCLLTVQWGLLSALIHNAEHTALGSPHPQPSALPVSQPTDSRLRSPQGLWPARAVLSAESVFRDPLRGLAGSLGSRPSLACSDVVGSDVWICCPVVYYFLLSRVTFPKMWFPKSPGNSLEIEILRS